MANIYEERLGKILDFKHYREIAEALRSAKSGREDSIFKSMGQQREYYCSHFRKFKRLKFFICIPQIIALYDLKCAGASVKEIIGVLPKNKLLRILEVGEWITKNYRPSVDTYPLLDPRDFSIDQAKSWIIRELKDRDIPPQIHNALLSLLNALDHGVWTRGSGVKGGLGLPRRFLVTHLNRILCDELGGRLDAETPQDLTALLGRMRENHEKTMLAQEPESPIKNLPASPPYERERSSYLVSNALEDLFRELGEIKAELRSINEKLKRLRLAN